MTRRFQRRKEDFCCLHCHAEVAGNGYTNHCPLCLWSLHVDNNPGDRQNPCRGLMRPIAVVLVGKKHIVHQCERCGQEKKNKIQEQDSSEALADVARAGGIR